MFTALEAAAAAAAEAAAAASSSSSSRQVGLLWGISGASPHYLKGFLRQCSTHANQGLMQPPLANVVGAGRNLETLD